MQLSEIRYITGLIKHGPTKVIGYSLAEPTCEVRKPDLVLTKDMQHYLTTHKCKIVNATIDSYGQARFKTSADENSYVTMNSSGYILGWPKVPLSKLHRGNKTMDTTINREVPTHSYIVVDVNETEGVVKVMNLCGMVKPMHLQQLLNAVGEGLIISNAEVKNGKLLMLNTSLDDLTINKPAQPAQPAQPASRAVIPPVSMTQPTKPVQSPVQPPVQSAKPVQPPVQPVKPAVKSNIATTLDFKDMAEKGYNFDTDFVSEFKGQKVRIKLNLYDFAPNQFELTTINGATYLCYTTTCSGDDTLDYFGVKYGQQLFDFLELFSMKENRELLSDVKIDLWYIDKYISGMDYRMLYKEQGMLNFAYLLDWNKFDLFHLTDERTYTATPMHPHVSLLVLPNKKLDIQANTIVDTDSLYGKFSAFYKEVWYNLLLLDNLITDTRLEDLRIIPHPKSHITETKEGNLKFFFDYPFGHHKHAHNLVIDLTNTGIRFIAKGAIEVVHGANYEIYVPATCKRIHEKAVTTAESDNYAKRYSLNSNELSYHNQAHEGKTNSNVTKANTITFHGTQIERIDKVGAPWTINKYCPSREFIRLSDWTPVTVLNETTVAIEDLPVCEKHIDLQPYLENPSRPCSVDKWYGLGTWSNIGKGKLSINVVSNPNEIKDTVNLLIDGSVSKVKLNLVSELERLDYHWPSIKYLFVEEGVTELEIIDCVLSYQQTKKIKTLGYTDSCIRYLILPSSLTSLSIKITNVKCSRFIENISIADNSVMARLDLREQFKRFSIMPYSIYKYACEKQQHDKNILSDFIGADLTHVELVAFDEESIKSNLALCGINL